MKKNPTLETLVSQMKKLIGVHQFKIAANHLPDSSETGTGVGDGSSVQKEGGGESMGPPLESRAPSIHIEDLTHAEGENSPPFSEPPSKRPRLLPSDSNFNPELDRGVSTVVTHSGAGTSKKGPPHQVGKRSLQEITEFAASIPLDSDWAAMRRLGYVQ